MLRSKQTFSTKTANDERIDHYLERVVSHLSARGTLKPTLTKFRYIGLKAAVKRLLESGFSDTADYQTCFESLRDFDCIDTWLQSIQSELTGYVPRSYLAEDLQNAKLLEVKADAERLGQVVLDKKEYSRLLVNETKYFETIRKAEGWPISLL